MRDNDFVVGRSEGVAYANNSLQYNQFKNQQQVNLQPQPKLLTTRKDGLTSQEGIVMDHLIEAWNEYIKLIKQHPSDLDDFCDGIHKCQYALTMRILRRDYPEGYPIKS